jgi:DNA (cytosine-5)-methyltransferase 1
MQPPLTFFEFFAGGGMARLGLGPAWRCTFANEWCEKKAASYRANFHGAPELAVCDVASLSARDLPGTPTLVWASFPCQDLSLAGGRAGLRGDRSGTFRPFWRLIERLTQEGRGPTIVALENVTGTLTSHGGRDFRFIIARLASAGYRAGVLVIDAAHFVPQSRPRLFIIATRETPALDAQQARLPWHTRAVVDAYAALPRSLQKEWTWWPLPAPNDIGTPAFSSILEKNPAGVEWHTRTQTRHLISLMSPLHRAKLDEAKRAGRPVTGALYRRTRNGMQRAEVRFDELSGCLRTPGGGSSRQSILIVDGPSVTSRLLSPKEAARLMGVPETYELPPRYNDAYHLLGDGLVVPVVSWLEQHLLRPLAAGSRESAAA